MANKGANLKVSRFGLKVRFRNPLANS